MSKSSIKKSIIVPTIQLTKEKKNIDEFNKFIETVSPEFFDQLIRKVRFEIKEEIIKEIKEEMITKEEFANKIEETTKFQKDADININTKIDNIPKLVSSCINKHYVGIAHHREKVKELISSEEQYSSIDFAEALVEMTSKSLDDLQLCFPSLNKTRY